MNPLRVRDHARRVMVTALTSLAFASVLAVPGASAAPSASARTLDTQPPSVPQGQVVVVAARSATMRWNASSDNVGVAGYRLFKNGVRVATTKARTFTYRNLRCRTTYTFALEAFDAAGNVSNRAEATGTRTTRACPAATTKPQAKPKPKQPRTKKPRTQKRPIGSTLANLWVDPSGGSCVRRESVGLWRDAQACSWNQAYGKARSGDLILVRGGNYGDVSIGPDRPGVTGVVFRSAQGERPVIGEFENGHFAGHSGASNVSFIGPATARTFRSNKVRNVVVGGWNVDCGGCANIQTFHLDGDNITVRNSEISDNTDAPLIWISGANLTFENNRIHDAGLRAGTGAHTECMYAWDVTNLTLKRNHFYHCAVMDVFITGSSVANGGYIENNVFEKPWSTTGVIGNGFAFHFRNGGDPSPDPNNWDFRHNTFVGPLSISSENPVGSGGMRVTGNVFLASAPSCALANTNWSHNAFTSSACGTNAIRRPLGTYAVGFQHTGDPGSYSLRSNSVLRDRGDPTNHPLRDRAGKLRTGRPDVGAHEFR